MRAMNQRAVPTQTSSTPSVEYAVGLPGPATDGADEVAAAEEMLLAAEDSGRSFAGPLVALPSEVTTETVPAPSRLPMALRSFGVRNFRLFFIGQVVSLIGSSAQATAQDLLVLHLGGRGPELGLITAAQLAPMLVLGLFTGVLIDRVDKRVLLVVAQTGLMLSALGLAVVDLAGAANILLVTVFALVGGVFLAVEIPTRQSFFSELVGPELVPNAVGLNSVSFNGSRLVGPALAGIAVGSLGTGAVLLANAASFLAVIAALLMMRPADLVRRAPVARAKGQLREGLAYVRSHEAVLTPIALAGVVGSVGINFQVTLPLMSVLLAAGSAGYGLLVGAFAAGALVAAVLAARRRSAPRRLLLLAVAGFGVSEALCGLAPNPVVLGLLLVPTGFCLLTATTTANVTVQLNAEPHVRGRVVGLYVLVFLAGTPVGAPIVGLLCHVLGVRATLGLTGGVVLASALVATALAARKTRQGR